MHHAMDVTDTGCLTYSSWSHPSDATLLHAVASVQPQRKSRACLH